MAINKEKKQQIIQTIKDTLKNAMTVVFVSFSGLTVSEISSIRKALREKDISYYVAKKTLIRRALSAYNYTGECPDLPGKIAVVLSATDEITPAQEIYEQGKKKKETLNIVGGIFNGSYVDAEYMQSIAIIPPMPVLRGMFVNIINSPIQGFVTALDQIRIAKA